MANRLQAVKGTQDILPENSGRWKYIEQTAADIAEIFGYREIRVPTFEQTAVFTGSVGESSDIVQKEMYTFQDKADRPLTLRPEMTAGVVRSMIENGLLNNTLPQKVYYTGSCFRHEKPQAGRYREFHQFGVECFGTKDPSSDAEIIALAHEVLDCLGIQNTLLKLNSIGCPDCRAKYLEALKAYFTAHKEALDGDSLKRLDTNPMRILDSKVPTTIALMEDVPLITDYLCEDCRTHFVGVKGCLDLLGLPYEVDPKIVRGLDYYTNTVFEFISSDIGAQGTVCGGGRYNLLVERRGGKPTPGLGFAMGLERLYLVMEKLECPFPEPKTCDIFFASIGSLAGKKAFELAHRMRSEGFAAEFDTMGRSLKAQMKYADKIGAKYSVVLGEDEILKGTGKLKNMRTGEEIEAPLNEGLADHLYTTQISAALGELQDSVNPREIDLTAFPEIFHK